ncbi:MAG: hypothetical protein J6331_09310, partial [Lentisphaeria bacterium]|nr:hypothetical protein [Lentisphaeria bacterium]
NHYGADFDAYARNFRPLVLVMCESVKAVDKIDSILSVDGVDGTVIGPDDLSGSRGIPGTARLFPLSSLRTKSPPWMTSPGRQIPRWV